MLKPRNPLSPEDADKLEKICKIIFPLVCLVLSHALKFLGYGEQEIAFVTFYVIGKAINYLIEAILYAMEIFRDCKNSEDKVSAIITYILLMFDMICPLFLELLVTWGISGLAKVDFHVVFQIVIILEIGVLLFE